MAKPLRSWSAGILRVGLDVAVAASFGLTVLGILLLALLGIIAMNGGDEIKLQNFLRIQAEPDGWHALLLGAIACVIVGVGAIFVFIALRRIIGSLEAGDPFVPENAGRIRVLAAAIAVLTLTSYILPGIVAGLTEVFGKLGGGTITTKPDLDFNIPAWLAVIILLVLAQIFDEGARLRAEEQMTI